MGMEDSRKRFHDLMAKTYSVPEAYALLVSQHALLDRMTISEVSGYYRIFKDSGLDMGKLDKILKMKIEGEPGRTANPAARNINALLQ